METKNVVEIMKTDDGKKFVESMREFVDFIELRPVDNSKELLEGISRNLSNILYYGLRFPPIQHIAGASVDLEPYENTISNNTTLLYDFIKEKHCYYTLDRELDENEYGRPFTNDIVQDIMVYYKDFKTALMRYDVGLFEFKECAISEMESYLRVWMKDQMKESIAVIDKLASKE